MSIVQLTESVYAVEVPDNSLVIGSIPRAIMYYEGTKLLKNLRELPLPGRDSWRFLFTTKGATEEEAAIVVQLISNGKISGRPQYRRYDRDLTKDMPAKCWTRDPRHSLETLLTAKGLDPINNNYALIKKL